MSKFGLFRERAAQPARNALTAQRERAPLALEAEALAKTLGARRIVADAALAVRRGEGVALVGPNGAGKTTLLLLLSGALAPDAGRIRVAGHAATTREARQALGFVPQEPAVYPELSGAENVALFGRLLGLRGQALVHGVERALSAADLLAARDLRVRAYSGGMTRRLSVACALVHAPKLLLLDESFVGIDDDSRARLFQVLLAQKRQGLALVLSTHRLDEVETLCDRVIRLRDGQIESHQLSGAQAGSERAALRTPARSASGG